MADDLSPILTQQDIDQRVFDLYDEYCHGRIDRRSFLAQAAVVVVGGLAMAQALLPRYARAQTISFTDERMKARYVSYPSPGGNSGTMRGYLVEPAGKGLFPVGGYPGNDDDGRTLQSGLDQGKLRTDMLNSARFLKAHALSSGKLGVTGFCWGGSTSNWLAVALGADLKAAAPYYGAAAADTAPSVKAAILGHYAENDAGVNATRPPYEAALKSAGVAHDMHVYPGTQHGFHNNSTPRYQEAAAKLSWERTIAHFKKHLA